MNLLVRQFIEQFEREAVLSGSYRIKLGKAETAFLNNVWGPTFEFDFTGLKAEFPFKDFKGGQRFADFVYINRGIKLVVEIDGFTTHAREISPGEFSDHLQRQNDLILSGWLVLRFSDYQVNHRAQICGRQIKQAIGHWWSVTKGTTPANRTDLWNTRKAQIVRIACDQWGNIRAGDVAAAFSIGNRAAAVWLKRLSDDGTLQPDKGQQRTTRYRLCNYRAE